VHLDELAATGEQGGEMLLLGIGEGPLGRTNGLREMGEQSGIELVGLSKLAGGFGELASLAWIDHGDCQAGGGEGGHGEHLIAARGFQDDEGGSERFELVKQGVDPGVIVGDPLSVLCLAGVTQRHIEMGFSDVDATKEFTHLILPRNSSHVISLGLADADSRERSRQLFELAIRMSAVTQALPRS
jgi:hypothetical protein